MMCIARTLRLHIEKFLKKPSCDSDKISFAIESDVLLYMVMQSCVLTIPIRSGKGY